MTKQTLGTFCVLFFLVVSLAGQSSWGAGAAFKLTIRVVDDQGNPVPQSPVGFAWGLMHGPLPESGQTKKLSDANGLAVYEGFTPHNIYAYSLDKAGYYSVSLWNQNIFERVQKGRWLPWNPTRTIVLKRILNPAPMYAKQVAVDIPEKDKAVGYDLEMGDWVVPYGVGVHTDMEFFAGGEVKDRSNYSGLLMVSFPGPGNGIQDYDIPVPDGSELRMPYTAPDEGYSPRWTWRGISRVNEATHQSIEWIDDSSITKNFFIRVRSLLNGEGKVVSALYGKIPGPFGFDPRGITKGKCSVSFTYYLNPDHTRNVEFDPKRNLFKPKDHLDLSVQIQKP